MKTKRLVLVFTLIFLLALANSPLAFAGNAWIFPQNQTGGSLDQFHWLFGYDDAADNDIKSYVFRFGDGSYENGSIYPNNELNTHHTFYNMGTFTQELGILDAWDNLVGYATAKVVIDTRWAPVP